MDLVERNKKLNIKQLAMVEILAQDPGISNKELSEQVGICMQTVRDWKNHPVVIDIFYERFMEIAGRYLPNVLMAQIREAELGNTQAATLVLKHFGKFQDTITVKIEAPFNQFLKSANIEDAEIVKDDAIKIGNSFELTEKKLPDRNPKNDKPVYVKKKQTQKLNKVYKHRKHLNNRNERYRWLTRAKAVNVDPLPKGRPSKEKLRKWHNSIVEAEKKFANGILPNKQKSPE